MNVGLAIKLLRERLSPPMTQAELSEASGVDAGNLSRIENGRQSPTLDRLTAIAGALGVPISAIFQEAERLSGRQPKAAGDRGEIDRLVALWLSLDPEGREALIKVLRLAAPARERDPV